MRGSVPVIAIASDSPSTKPVLHLLGRHRTKNPISLPGTPSSSCKINTNAWSNRPEDAASCRIDQVYENLDSASISQSCKNQRVSQACKFPETGYMGAHLTSQTCIQSFDRSTFPTQRTMSRSTSQPSRLAGMVHRLPPTHYSMTGVLQW